MDVVEQAASQLEALVKQVRARGDAELASQLGEIATSLRTCPAPDTLLTTGQAAAQLGVRSVNTIKRWVHEGILNGCQRGGRVMVSKASADKMQQSRALGRQRKFEQELSQVLEAFDAGDELLPPSRSTSAGRKPWERVRSATG
jgi:ubiquinone biosynthesis protein UbiJ